MELGGKVPICASSNLGTHIALLVIPTLNASHLKREIEEAHFNCFPQLGKIKINGVMVKRKSNFYHLPDSLCIKHVFKGFRGLWSVYFKACLISDIVKPTSTHTDTMLTTNSAGNSNGNYSSNHKTDTIGANRSFSTKFVPSSILHEKGNGSINGCCAEGEVSDNHNKAISDVVSVSGIIKKYFGAYENEISNSEVISSTGQSQRKEPNNDHCSKEIINEERKCAPRTPSRTLIVPLVKSSRGKGSTNKCRIGEVGKRFLKASNELGMFKSSLKASTGLYRRKNKKRSSPTFSSLTRRLVFEINDDDE